MKTKLARVAVTIIDDIAKLQNCCEKQQYNIECSQGFSHETKSNGSYPNQLADGGAHPGCLVALSKDT